VHPHAERIAEIAVSGDIGVVLFEPCVDNPARRATIAILQGTDHVGEACFPLPHERALEVFKDCDHVTLRWMGRRVPPEEGASILLLVHHRTLLLNWRIGHGYELEPGSRGNGSEDRGLVDQGLPVDGVELVGHDDRLEP
jgi:hypothetical protein